ncbi:MAG: hypothetical protein AWU54_323 [Candidatus Frackibacter sp. T328-2]|nr:MAG: hypothetical protein AWU54_323 [Candidatus Frackibacter sp. T328-2]
MTEIDVGKVTDDERAKIKALLEEYPQLKSKIKIKIIDSHKEYALQAVDFKKVSGGETNAIFSDVESYVTNKEEVKQEVINLIKKRDIIAAALECLNKREMKVVRYKYFEGESDLKTGCKMEVSERTISNWKDDIFAKLKKVGILEIKID